MPYQHFPMALVRELVRTTRGRFRLYALGLLPILLALVPLADASPPDPTWLTGFYDDADFDEVVVAVVSTSAVVNGIVLPSVKTANVPARTPWPRDAVVRAAAPLPPVSIRAPPSARPLPREPLLG